MLNIMASKLVLLFVTTVCSQEIFENKRDTSTSCKSIYYFEKKVAELEEQIENHIKDKLIYQQEISIKNTKINELQTELKEIQNQDKANNEGKTENEFWFTFPQNFERQNNRWQLFIYITSKFDSDVTLTVQDNSGFVSHTFNKSLTLEIDRKMELKPNIMEKKGIRVTSNDSISVTGYSIYGYWTSAAFNVIPLVDLGQFYIVVSSHPRIDSLSFVSIVAMHPNTTVTITLNMTGEISYDGRTYRDGDIFVINLNQFGSFQLSDSTDLTGTTVLSNKIIVVQSGSTLSVNDNADNYFSMFLPPIASFGSSFVLPQFMSAFKTSVRVVPAYNDTSMLIKNKKGTEDYQLNKTLELDISLVHPVVITCSKPCLVAEIFSSTNPPCNSMTIIPSVSQYSNNYTYITPNDGHYTYTDYIAIVVNSTHIHSLSIDGKNIYTYTRNASDTVEIGTINMTIMSIKLNPGTHSITSDIVGSYYGVIAYGLRPSSAYAFPLGMRLA